MASLVTAAVIARVVAEDSTATLGLYPTELLGPELLSQGAEAVNCGR